MNHRKEYLRKHSKTWWLSKSFYTRYMLREVSSFFIGVYMFVVLVGLMRLSEGEAAYNAFLLALQGPWSILFHITAFLLICFHAISWFNVTPQAMPLYLGDKPVPGAFIIGAHYAAWFVASAVVFLFAAGGV
ncbi:MAG: fumarate reductase subunit C [Gammaproteobacteria bacterium]|nr:fumarate reductase subunit C [Gammaproteobacteria bacterium]